MINIYRIRKALKKEATQFLGRGGVVYFDGVYEYNVGTENFVPMKGSKYGFGVCIFPMQVNYRAMDIELSTEEKEAIVSALCRYLAKKRIGVEFAR